MSKQFSSMCDESEIFENYVRGFHMNSVQNSIDEDILLNPYFEELEKFHSDNSGDQILMIVDTHQNNEKVNRINNEHSYRLRGDENDVSFK